MGQYFYLTPQNEQKGPVEASQLVTLGVNANTLVWTEGMAQWAPAGQVQELASFFAPAAQPAKSVDHFHLLSYLLPYFSLST